LQATFHSLVAIVAGLLFFGCGGKRDREFSSPSADAKTVSTAVVDSINAGLVDGTVFLDGPVPVVRPINMDSEPACARANGLGRYQQSVVTGDNAALANVVVYVKGGFSNYRFATPTDPVVLDQKGCMYAPRIVALMSHQPLEIRNEDATIHNVHAMAKANGEWNKAQRAGGAALETSFPRPESAIPFMCNVHPWMRAFIFVFDNPYYSVTSSEGKFELKNLPPGTYTIEAWHEKFGIRTQTVTVSPRQSRTISFRFKSTPDF
jgi:plastocyanin